MKIIDVIKGLLVRICTDFIQILTKVDQQKAAFLITGVFQDNCIIQMNYLLFNTNMKCVLLTDRKTFYKYASLYHDNSSVKVICKELNRIQAYVQMLTSKYVFYMHMRPYVHIKRRSSQLLVNLWHGTGYKASELKYAADDKSREFDIMLVPGPAFIKTKAAFFNCKEEQIIPIGYPRYDILLQRNEKAITWKEKIMEESHSERIILWMPTFRVSEDGTVGIRESKERWEYDLPILKNKEDLSELNSIAKANKILLIIKRHPYQKAYMDESLILSNIMFIDNTDLEEWNIALYSFLSCSDALISDYSSVAVDYLLLDRPVAYTLGDYDQYKQSRGFVFENSKDYMPGYHLYGMDDLKRFIQDIAKGKDCHKPERIKMIHQMQNPCDNYCKRIWETVQKMMDEDGNEHGKNYRVYSGNI